MPRTIDASLRQALEQQEAGEGLICFVTISHPKMSTDLHVVSDPHDHVWGGVTYTGVLFDWQLVTDDDRVPQSQVVVQNVDRIVNQYVRPLDVPPRVKVDLLKISDFNTSVDPRTEIGSPEAEYIADKLFLTEVEGNTLDVRGTLRGYDFTQEIWPGDRATQARVPGLYR